MAWQALGEVFDIHGGGHDLVFPHHENEVAQSRCAFGTPRMANVWLHNGMLRVDGEKMSKSLGNFSTVRDILGLGAWAGEAFRLLTLRTHYRQAMDFTSDALEEAKAELDDGYAMLARALAPPEAEATMRGDGRVGLGAAARRPEHAARVGAAARPAHAGERRERGRLGDVRVAPRRPRLAPGARLGRSGVPRGGGPSRPLDVRPGALVARRHGRRTHRSRHRGARRGAQGARLRRGRPHPRPARCGGRRAGGRAAGHHLAARMTGRDGGADLAPPPGELPIVVLVRPQLAENIGAAARAMANGGLFHLRLVAPRDGWPQERAWRMASGADRILEAAAVFPDLPAALADCHRVFATCPRLRHVIKPLRTARAAAEDLRDANARGLRVAVLFGPERAGLDNDDIACADTLVRYPAESVAHVAQSRAGRDDPGL